MNCFINVKSVFFFLSALEKLKTVKGKKDMQVSSSPSSDTVETSGQHVLFASPYEGSSPEDGKFLAVEQ